jgi:MFS family permease
MALFVSTLVVFLAVVNISSVNVAFPSIREDFGSTDAELSWIVGAYNLVVGSLLLAAGRLSDSLGRRRVYLPGVASSHSARCCVRSRRGRGGSSPPAWSRAPVARSRWLPALR